MRRCLRWAADASSLHANDEEQKNEWAVQMAAVRAWRKTEMKHSGVTLIKGWK